MVTTCLAAVEKSQINFFFLFFKLFFFSFPPSQFLLDLHFLWVIALLGPETERNAVRFFSCVSQLLFFYFSYFKKQKSSKSYRETLWFGREDHLWWQHLPFYLCPVILSLTLQRSLVVERKSNITMNPQQWTMKYSLIVVIQGISVNI